MSTRDCTGLTVLISGAASGLGRALAGRFASAGARPVLLDRDVAALQRAADELKADGKVCLAVPCDVTDAAACEAAVQRAFDHFGRVDILINNAGITHRSAFEATQMDVLRRVMDVNLFGAIHLTRPALPHLRRARGLIIVVSSVAGYSPLIARTGYAASKHAVHGFFESLRTELAPDGVQVMLVCPSFIATGIDRNALGPDGTPATHAQVVVGRRLTAAAVADRVYDGAVHSRRLLLIGRTARAAWWVSRLAPALYEKIMARRLRGEMQ
jgi:NAD(P)-dependent dehydrogenase (short-subunit alcohol dehydrogenase family)